MVETPSHDGQKRAVVLLSGGLDSTVTLHLARSMGYEVHALSFRYGQRHGRELECALWQGRAAGVASHRVVDIDFSSWDTSALMEGGQPLESGNTERTETPNSYVPARNMVFLSVAASLAESLGISEIHIGVSEVDYSGYVDCRAEFLEAMEGAINAGTERRAAGGRPIRPVAPFIHSSKAEEVREGLSLGVDFAHTWSCYAGGDRPCMECDSCLLRLRAFDQNGMEDPLLFL